MRPLKGLRVLDLTHMLSGPYATMMLADLGADLIKVEPPQTGEGTRRLLADSPGYNLKGMGAYYITLNRNKRSITLNLKSEEGLKLFYRLVETADIVIDNFSVGVTQRLKIDYEHLSAINPRIITASITGFGGKGPSSHRTAFDLVAQGMGGGMSITGQPDGPPTRAGIPIGDLGGGVMGTIGVLSAVIARHSTGLGQHVDISMQDAQISLLNYMATMYFLSGELPERIGNNHFAHVPYGTFSTANGHLIIAILTDGFWLSLLKTLDLLELDLPQYRDRESRLRYKAEIDEALNARLSTQDTDHWLPKLESVRIPCAPVYNFAEALHDPHLEARDMIIELKHPEGGATRAPGNPIKLSRDTEQRYTPAPLLGQHNEEVWGALGLSADELKTLAQEGII